MRLAASLVARGVPFLVFALVILLLSYDVLPDTGGVLNYSDGAYAWPSGGFDLISTWSASNTGFPFIAQSFATFQYVPNALTSFLFHLGRHGDAWHSYVLYYSPLYACMLIMFFMARDMSGSVAYGYFAGIVLVMNNFILEQLLVWPVTYFYCLAGLLAQFYVLWRIHEDGASIAKVCASVLISILPHHPFMFVVHFSAQVLFLAFLLARRRLAVPATAAIVGGGMLMQAYWLVPFVYNLMNSSVAETNRASGESAYVGYSYTIKYRTLFNLVNYPMALDPRINDAVHNFAQTAFNYVMAAVLVAALLTALRRASARLPEMFFLLALYVFFFNLALGPNSEITGPAWKWSYANVPGFAFFRSFNRFEIVTLIAMILLGALLYSEVRSRYKAPVLLALLVFNLASYSIFFGGTFNGMVTPAHVPAEYYRANQKYFRVNDGQVILSLPSIPYETYAWQVNQRNDLTNPAMYFMFYFMNAPVIFNQYANFLDRQLPEYSDVLKMYFDAAPLDEAGHDRIRRLGVTHVIVHKDRLNTLNRNDRIIPWKRYRDEFAATSRYTLLEDNEYFALFALKHPMGLVSGPGVLFKGITQTKYELLVRGLRGPVEMRFAQSFHPDWKLYASTVPWEEVPDTGIQENRVYFRDVGHLFAPTAVNDESHRVVDSFANSWTLDPRKLRATLPRGAYRENPDGSIDVRLQLYFRPQAILMLGIAITLLTGAACIALLVLGVLRPRPRAAEPLAVAPHHGAV